MLVVIVEAKLLSSLSAVASSFNVFNWAGAASIKLVIAWSVSDFVEFLAYQSTVNVGFVLISVVENINGDWTLNTCSLISNNISVSSLIS